MSAEGRCEWLWEQIKKETKAHPMGTLHSFKIFYGIRTGRKHPVKSESEENFQDSDIAKFHLFVLSWDHKERRWHEQTKIIKPSLSYVLLTDGTGREAVNKWNSVWHDSEQKNTSRVVFSAFCDALGTKSDLRSGGSPQLVGVYWDRNAITFGVHTPEHGATFQGSPHLGYESGNVQWRNHLFERVNPNGEVLKRAQRHSRPKLANPMK